MKKSILILIIIVVVLIVVYLILPKKGVIDYSDYVVKDFDDQIIIELDSNPTTGYMWEAHYDDQYLSKTNQEYFADPSGEEMVGTGGREIFIFTPIKIGKTEIIFDYKRQWEDEPIETQHFKFNIVE